MTTIDDFISAGDDLKILSAFEPFTVFWNSLHKSKLENGLLKFEMINPFENNYKSIVARDCYFKLWDIINKPGAARNVLITGSPGIGKSIFLLFVMCKCKLEGKSFVYRHFNDVACFLFHGDKVYKSAVPSGVFSILSHPDVWFLADSIPPLTRMNRSLMVSSPHESLCKNFKKAHPCATYYMPIWSYEECLLNYNVSHADKFSMKNFQKRFELCGGIARHIFDDYFEYFSFYPD